MNKKRILPLNNLPYSYGKIIYWMSRDQRVNDNWALIYAQELAKKNNTSFAVVFCLRETFENATERLVDFMLQGLEEVEKTLSEKNIPFFFLLGNPEEKIPEFIEKNNIGCLIADFSPLHYNRSWKENILKKITIPFYEIDTHNIVPVWRASSKQEFGAYTIRPKITFLLDEFLDLFPEISQKTNSFTNKKNRTDWNEIRKQLHYDETVPAITWLMPGEKAAIKALDNFIGERLTHYNDNRNDPSKHAQSQLSPFLHFGHIASQRIALELQKVNEHVESKKAFLEELIIRKELSDNYCYYNTNYDNPNGFPEWAKKTLADHALDKREYLYSRDELEKGKTHDPLWNAAQNEMRHTGKMHGYMRMYWAKKIFEWTKHVKEAQQIAIFLNDKYFLDGRDPNGYTGIAWSMGGVHDRAWFEKEIFGKIRYMNYNGAKSKFDIKKYIADNQL